jgi:outer membrane murein-binding lipoprotein Lpp
MSLPVVFAVIAAGSKIAGGIQQQKMYNLQAEQSRLQGQREALRGRIGALNANNQALNVLRDQRRFYSAVNARAAAGGVSAFEGSPAEVKFQQGILSGRDFDIARENALQSLNAGLEAQLAGEAQAGIYKEAGKNALIGSIFEAGMSAYGGYKFGKELQTPGAFGGGSPNAEIEVRQITPLPQPMSPSSTGTYGKFY